MRAVQLISHGAPVRDRDVPPPSCGPGEVVVRVGAAGICRSDAHYRRAGRLGSLPRTLGHEIAGTIERAGPGVSELREGDRVAVHYLLSCGACRPCRTYGEQFCATGAMIGKDIDGGWAERIAVPARNAVVLPNDVPLAHGAVMMCSSATALHSLRVGGIREGSTVAVFGIGGLGVSAIQIARALAGSSVFAVDRVPAKLALAARLGAEPVEAGGDAAAEIRRKSEGGVDIAVDLVGSPSTTEAAVRSLAPRGTAVLVGLDSRPFAVDPYRDLLAREARVAGCSDHLLSEISELIELARRGSLDLSHAVTRTVSLDAAAIDACLSDLEEGTSQVRSVIELTADR